MTSCSFVSLCSKLSCLTLLVMLLTSPAARADTNSTVCDPFRFGVDCSVTCPGLDTSGTCSDAGCFGLGPLECGDTCSYIAESNTCIGTNSCVTGVCSGSGECQYSVSTNTATCQCAANYYGANCDAFCSPEACVARYNIADLVCLADGSCGCPSGASGHYKNVESLCSECDDGWFGVHCSEQCFCNGHGSCDRLTGACVCYDDDINGHWIGAECDICDEHYVNDCKTKNIVFSPTYSVTLNVDRGGSTSGGDEWLSWRSRYSSATGFFTPDSDGNAVVGFKDVMIWLRLKSGDETVEQGQTVIVNGSLWSAASVGINSFVVLGTAQSEDGVNEVFVLSNVEYYSSSSINQEPEVPTDNFSVAQSWTVAEEANGLRAVFATITAKWGWAVLYPGYAFLEHRGLVPLNASFEPLSLCVSNTTGTVYFTGAQDNVWKLYTTHMKEDSEVVSMDDEWEAINVYKTALRCVLTDDDALYVALTNGSTAAGSTSISISRFSKTSARTTTHPLATPLLTDAVLSDIEDFHPFLQSSDMVWDSRHQSLHLLTTTMISDEHLRSVWFSVSREPPDTLSIYQRQVVFDTVAANEEMEGQRALGFLQNAPSAFVVLDALEMFSFLQPNTGTGDSIDVGFYTSYAVTGVQPDNIDVTGGVPVSLSGVFFNENTRCVFMGTVLETTLINSSTVSCVIPDLMDDDECTGEYVEAVSNGALLTTVTNNKVPLYRHSTPSLTGATSAAGAYGSILYRNPITVYGQGFVNLTTLECLFTDSAGLFEKTRGILRSSGAVECTMPSISRPTQGSSGRVAVSLDGVTFSDPTPFDFVGPPHALKVQTDVLAVTCAATITLPSIYVTVVDEEGHPLSELDTSNHVVTISAPWFNSTRAEVQRNIDPLEFLVIASYSNRTREGGTFFTVTIQAPLVGVGLLSFSSSGLESDSITYTVSEGTPASMELAIEPSLLEDLLNASWSRQPVVFFRDIAGNAVRTLTSSPLSKAVIHATYDNGTQLVDVTSARATADGYFAFTDVFPRGKFGKEQRVSFWVDGFENLTSSPISMTNCYSNQYAVYDTSTCRSCLKGAVCNGSYAVTVKDGYWKAAEIAYVIYPCSLPYVCKNNGCARGYTGPLCSVCKEGFGKLSRLCVKCYSTAVNVVLVVLLILFFVLWMVLIVLALLQSATGLRLAVQAFKVFLDHLQILSIVVLPVGVLPKFTEQTMVFVRFWGIADYVRLPPVSCLFPVNIHVTFVMQLVYPCVFTAILLVVLWYGDRLYMRHCKRMTERRLLLAGVAPYDDEEAYEARMAELGLNEEPMFGEETSASVDELEPQKMKLKQAYALLDKNSSALASIAQLPTSRVREAALRSLLEEQEELTGFVERYESYVSRDEKGAAAYMTSHSGSFSGADVLTNLSGSTTSINRSSRALKPLGSSVGVSTKEASAPLPPPAAAAGSAGGTIKHPLRQTVASAYDASEHSVSAGGSLKKLEESIDVGEAYRFPEVTPTFFSLFGDREPFNPIIGSVDLFSDKLIRESENAMDVVHARRRLGVRWVKVDHRLLFVLAVFTHYFYAAIVFYGFSMGRCIQIDSGYTKFGDTLVQTEGRNVVSMDPSIACNDATHRSYRVAAIVICSCLGGGYPILLAVFSMHPWFARSNLQRIVQSVLGYRRHMSWWQSVVLVRRLVPIVLITTASSSSYFMLVVISWIFMFMLSMTLLLHPYASGTIHKLECFSLFMAIVCINIQLFPYMRSSTVDQTVSEAMGALLVSAIAISIVVLLGAVIFLLFREYILDVMEAYNCNPIRGVHSQLLTWLYGDTVIVSDKDRSNRPLEHRPFSASEYNLALLRGQKARLQLRAQVKVEREEVFDLEKQMTMLIRGRNLKGRGTSGKALDMCMNIGVSSGEGAASNTELLLAYIERNEIDLSGTVFDELASRQETQGRGLEKGSAVIQGAIMEHALQLRRYIVRLEKALKQQEM